MGDGMFRPLRTAGLFLTLSLMSSLSIAYADDCKLQQLASLDLKTDSQGHLLVPVTIAGSQRQLLLDIQAAYTGITENTANALSLVRERMPKDVRVMVGGHWITELARVPAFQMGSLHAENIKLLVGFDVGSASPAADGLLGLDFLHGQDVELDIAHAKLNLFSSHHCPGQVIYWKSPGNVVAAIPLTLEPTANMLVHMKLDGQAILAGITSASPSEIGMSDAHRLFGLDEHSGGLSSTSNPEWPGKTYYSFPFKNLQVEGLTVQNPAILIVPESDDHDGPSCDPRGRLQSKTCFGNAEVFLGLSVLRKLHLYFAFGEKTLYATAAE